MQSVRLALLVLHLLLGVAAVAAGQAFVRDPGGGALGMTTEPLGGSPFPDYRVPGLFLAVVIGGANLASGVLLWRRRAFAPVVSFATGLLLVAWVAVQTAIIGFLHWSQLIWWTLFPLVALLAGVLAARTGRPRGR